MRFAPFVSVLLLVSACNRQPEAPPEVPERSDQAPANVVAPDPSPAAEKAPVAAIPESPPEDPGVASLSPSRRREYERGYRDCRTGDYDYDAQTQGEYYRIGCMAAENLKAGAEP